VDNRPLALTPTSKYNEFLFAPVCEEANGMRLSVLSALARMNVDPWEEAARLAAMPKEVAEKTLVSTFDLVSASIRKPSEAEAMAARLVRLLPHRDEGATAAATEIAGVRATDNFFVDLGMLCDSNIDAVDAPTPDDAGRGCFHISSQPGIPIGEPTVNSTLPPVLGRAERSTPEAGRVPP
jgi:hypothetical protein